MFLIGINYFLGFENFAEKMKTFNPESLSLQGSLIYFGCMLLLVTLLAPFNAGLLKIMKDADEGSKPTLNTLFYYVNTSYFLNIIVATVFIGIFNFGFNFSIQKLLGNESMLGKFLPMFFSVIFSIATLTVLPNLIFKNSSIINAIKESFVNGLKNFLSILVLLIIAIAIGYLGIFAFCIGIFFTFPIYYAMQYAIFKSLN